MKLILERLMVFFWGGGWPGWPWVAGGLGGWGECLSSSSSVPFFSFILISFTNFLAGMTGISLHGAQSSNLSVGYIDGFAGVFFAGFVSWLDDFAAGFFYGLDFMVLLGVRG
jgi:hypothetical protein